ncbi:MAG: ABC transporter ATP-binding protein [Dehalococcoidia bacterium]|jgi:ABC-type branched-subunit amino acid transport system ATPase component|nr:MAG: ABC transporter ATP-binding protein [Dehalococcoidia bacterium]
MSLLKVSNIVAGYGETEILHGVSIAIEEGHVVTIIGPNGSGKSTLLKAIFGLIKPKKGQVLFQGKDITGLAPETVVRRGLCYVPQSSNIFPSLSINENLEMGAFIRTDDFRQRLEEMYLLFPDLAGRRKDRAGTLSGGQRQMLALARALMLDPALLLLDEPSAGLAPSMVGSVFEKILGINRSGVAILLVEQNAREALQLSSWGYVLASGQNQLEDRGENLLSNPDVTRLYLGG